jgi:hypothetical protein
MRPASGTRFGHYEILEHRAHPRFNEVMREVWG